MERRFVKISYTGRIKDAEIFDTTDAEAAKKEGIYEERRIYEPVPIVTGEGHVLPGLDEAIKDMKKGEEKQVTLPPEKAYGNKDPNQVKLVPMKVFKQQKITPYPGMKLELDGRVAKIQTVSGGRVRVDFNSDLAGKTLVYDVKIDDEATDDTQKVGYLLERSFNTQDGFGTDLKKGALELTVPETAYRDRNLLMRKASFAAEAFKYLDLEDVTFRETWKNRAKKAQKPETEAKKAEKAEEKKTEAKEEKE